LAKKEGIQLDPNYIYSVRTAAKIAAKVATKTTTMVVKGKNGVVGASRAESILKAAAAVVGLARAVEIIEAEREQTRVALESALR